MMTDINLPRLHHDHVPGFGIAFEVPVVVVLLVLTWIVRSWPAPRLRADQHHFVVADTAGAADVGSQTTRGRAEHLLQRGAAADARSPKPEERRTGEPQFADRRADAGLKRRAAGAQATRRGAQADRRAAARRSLGNLAPGARDPAGDPRTGRRAGARPAAPDRQGERSREPDQPERGPRRRSALRIPASSAARAGFPPLLFMRSEFFESASPTAAYARAAGR